MIVVGMVMKTGEMVRVPALTRRPSLVTGIHSLSSVILVGVVEGRGKGHAANPAYRLHAVIELQGGG